MKNLKYYVIFTCIAVLFCMGVSAGEFTRLDVSELYEDGEQSNYVEISNYAELCAFRDAVNNGENVGVNAVLTADVELAGEWTPIGNENHAFNGCFDGNGYRISGLSITNGGSGIYYGFFGNVSNGKISCIEFVEPVINVRNSNDVQNQCAGFAVGAVNCNGSKNSVTIEEIKVYGGSNSVSCANYSAYCAGIAGFCESDNYGTVYIKNCSVENVSLNAVSDSKSTFTGLVTGAFYSRSATDSAILNCVVQGSCTADASLSALGGLVMGTGFANGYWASAPSSLAAEDEIVIIDNCIASGSVATNAKVNSKAGSISGGLSAAAVVGNAYYTDDVILTPIKDGVETSAVFKGKIIPKTNLYDLDYVKNTVKLDVVDTWKVNSNAFPSLLAFDDGYFALDVEAGARLYYADGSFRDFDENKVAYISLSQSGNVYTLTGYDKQRVWRVFQESAIKLDELENALCTKPASQIRTREPAGMRFSASITDKAKFVSGMLELAEYGYLVTAENNVTGLVDGQYDLDFSLVDSGKAKQGVAYCVESNTDLVFEKDVVNENTVFTGVMYNIPLTKAGVTTVIATRPYYKTSDGNVVLGAVYKTTLYDTALAIKNENGDSYTQNKEYIDSILNLVQQ